MTTKQKVLIALAIAVVLAAAGAAIALKGQRSAGHTDHEEAAAATYFCPMHPSVVSDKPGSCPICGMALVKRSAPSPASDLAKSGSTSDLQSISLSPEQRVTANVQTVKVALDTHAGEMVTTGRVTFDERRVAQVTSYTGGRIEQLYVNFTGDAVRRGEAVAAIYSPDVYAAQQEYLLALQNRERMRRAGFSGARTAADDLVDSSRRRLALLGVTAGQIAQLGRGGKPLYTTTIISPVSGVVTKKNVVVQQYVAEGQPLLEVADLSNVWVEADVYETQLASAAVGQKVIITSPASPGVELPGTVSFVLPVVQGSTRTVRVRIDLANPGMRLKPDMYVNVRMYGTPIPPHIMVPASAVVDRGQKKFVWVEVGPNTFEPREVRTGERHGEAIVIVAGLVGGESIVADGGFLLDSEAQLRSATAGGGGEHVH